MNQLIGFVAGAIAGGLIERLLEEYLPATLRRFHILMVLGAILGLSVMSIIFSATSDGTAESTHATPESDWKIENNTFNAEGDVYVGETNGLNAPPVVEATSAVLNSGIIFTLEKGEYHLINIEGNQAIVTLIAETPRHGILGTRNPRNISVSGSSDPIRNFMGPTSCIHYHPFIITYETPSGVSGATISAFLLKGAENEIKDATDRCYPNRI